MALSVLEKKAYFIGTWKDDAVTDTIIKQIATLTSLEKGRKVKLKLSMEGLTITKSNIFLTKSLFDHIPLHDIFFMTINQRHPMCLMCVIRDPVHKYTIIAFRCASELIAGTFVQTFNGMKRSAGQESNVEFRKKDDGNWTLRERTNANARRELQQLFSSDSAPEAKPQINGGIFYKKSEKRNGESKKGNIYDQTPYSGLNSSTVQTEVYTEDYTTNNQIIPNVSPRVVHRDDDSMSQSSEMSSIKGEMEALSAELKEVKYLLEKSTGISAQEHYKMAGIKQRETVNNNESYAINYNRYKEPIVVDRHGSTSSSSTMARVDVPDYRGFGTQSAKTKEAQDDSGPEHLIANSYRNSSEQDKRRYTIHSVGHKGVEMRKSAREPEYSVARHSDGFEAEDGVIYAAQKEANVNTVAYPSSTLPVARTGRSARGSVTSTVISGYPAYVYDKKGRPIKVRHSHSLVPSIVERPIEDIYPKPVLIRRDYIVSRRNRRPHSMYVNLPHDDYVYGSQIITKEDF